MKILVGQVVVSPPSFNERWSMTSERIFLITPFDMGRAFSPDPEVDERI